MAGCDDARVVRFPRWRVLAGAFERTERWTTNRLGALAVIVIVTVLVGGIVGAAVGRTTLAALIGALAALLLVVAGKFVLELARYRLSAWKDPIWEAVCEQSGTPGMVVFGLYCKVQPPASIPDHLECVVKLPSGDVVSVPEASLDPRRPIGVLFDVAPATPGSYEVRWYGLSDRRKLYEITRAKFKVPVVSQDVTRLCRERQGATAAESAGQLGEDRQIGVEPDTIKPTDAGRE